MPKRGPKPNAPLCAPKRTRDQRIADLALISRLRIRGLTQVEIAAEIEKERGYHLSRQMISRELMRIRDRWISEAMENEGVVRAEMLAKLQEQYREAWAAWERSKQDATKRTAERTNDQAPAQGQPAAAAQDPGLVKQRITVEGQCGDPAYLREMRETLERMAALRGLDAPRRIETTGPAHFVIELLASELPQPKEAIVLSGPPPELVALGPGNVVETPMLSERTGEEKEKE